MADILPFPADRARAGLAIPDPVLETARRVRAHAAAAGIPETRLNDFTDEELVEADLCADILLQIEDALTYPVEGDQLPVSWLTGRGMDRRHHLELRIATRTGVKVHLVDAAVAMRCGKALLADPGTPGSLGVGAGLMHAASALEALNTPLSRGPRRHPRRARRVAAVILLLAGVGGLAVMNALAELAGRLL